MIKLLNFKIISYCYLLNIIFLSLTSHATQHEYKIEIYDTGQEQRFVNRRGCIENGYKERLMYLVNKTINTENIELWEDLKADTRDRQTRSMMAENATRLFFDSLGYKIFNKHYIERMVRLTASQDMLPIYGKFHRPISYEMEKGIDNGIDGVYILKEESFNNPTHLIINEAKFRDKLSLSTLDFGIITCGLHKIRQSHSMWNRERFNTLQIKELKYDGIKVIRTATLLNRDGILKLYVIKDITGPRDYFEKFPHYQLYPSQWKDDLPNSPILKNLLNI